MAWSAEQSAYFYELGVKTQAGVQDLHQIASAIEARDNTINSADADGAAVAGVHEHLFLSHNPIEIIYDDDDPAIINSLRLGPTAPHRAVDLAWYNESQELAGKVRIAIPIPATIFGKGSGFQSTRFKLLIETGMSIHHLARRASERQSECEPEPILGLDVSPDSRAEELVRTWRTVSRPTWRH
ncbi:hypothetical protein DFH07DRAFT_949933 [Mycena maculata]|uniref:Uncharacterized protein n=1 Tax=Mycena maculata TaxID=230809 RepID=A0AAD7K8V4_9AGAR|nr:hypothetical protein DFH07DRAFT_949933 [Mycena maculata]